MRRRDFIRLLGGAAAAGPVAVRAQQDGRVRRVGVLMGVANDLVGQSYLTPFRRELQELGWTDGGNVRIYDRWTAGDANSVRVYAAELLSLKPDVILVSGNRTLTALQQETRAIPTVFVGLVDPVGQGFVASMARPGDNLTGFTNFEAAIAGKWLEILKEIATRVSRVALMFHPDNASTTDYLRRVELVAPSFAVEPIVALVRDAAEVERAIEAFAGEPNSGLLVLPDNITIVHRDLIVALAAKHRLPAVYPYRYFVTGGGLISYGPDQVDQYRRAAGYVDRILKGEKPADLPVQAPTKYELVVNFKTAKALGLTVPPSILLRADEVIE
jgi:putative ABC transport system substrate-binding protein